MSGGGGWGAKKGLLSLDPKTQLGTDDAKDMQSFMDSFQKKGDTASPGTYVQFLVEAALPEQAQWSIPAARRWDFADVKTVTSVIGTPGAVVSADPLNAVASCPGLFGAVSSEGVHLFKPPSLKDDRKLTTRVDTPSSYVISNKRGPSWNH